MKSKSKRFPLLRAYPFAKQHERGKQVEEIQGMTVKWRLNHRTYTSTVRRGHMIKLFERHKLLDQFIDCSWPAGKTALGRSEIAHCKKVADEHDQPK